jgi:anthranilate 1,2-dioxygenase small subunit
MAVVIDPVLLARLDALQQQYVYSLDRRDMRGWLACFASDGRYTLTSAENRRMELPVGMMLDDCHERLRDRVKFVEEVWNHAVEHYQSRHVISRDRCTREAGEDLHASTSFSVFFTNAQGHSSLLAVGHYEDLVTEQDGKLLIRSRIAVMDTAVPPRYIIYPI